MGGSREGKLVEFGRAAHSAPRRVFDTGDGSGRSRHLPARAIEPEPPHPARRLPWSVALRSAVVAVVAATAGGIVYVALPVPSAAVTGHPEAVLAAAPVVAAPPTTVGLVGGSLDNDDLVDPIGVETAPPDPLVDGNLIGWPVTDHTPSSGFGYRSDPFTHRQRWHDGLDLGQPCGDPVWASDQGTVAFTGWAGGYGNRVIVRHPDRAGHSFATTYNHLSRIDVVVGQSVTRGQVIARVGSTGRSTACHLHFEAILDGSYVDPLRFLTGDQSKAHLSRRVGSYMPSGLPSPTSSATRTPTPTATTTSPAPRPSTTSPTPRPTSASPTPTPSSPSPSSPTASSPTPSSPTPSSPTPSSPAPSSPTPGTATPSPTPGTPTASPSVTPSPGTPAAGTGSPSPTPAGSTPAMTAARSATPTSASGSPLSPAPTPGHTTTDAAA